MELCAHLQGEMENTNYVSSISISEMTKTTDWTRNLRGLIKRLDKIILVLEMSSEPEKRMTAINSDRSR